jgi:hypothetical protein
MFKTRFGVAPREYRDQHLTKSGAPILEAAP